MSHSPPIGPAKTTAAQTGQIVMLRAEEESPSPFPH